ncbi:MAG: hypothetical protein KZQ66_21330 [Candidatus Thiodiazotropha sp. (ex Lucinoma aequizonata)]|nr:hypothetical protein [Candidatus Thiodiazotropha sp. (ex Lucinoma aequizonata)]
MTEEETSRDVRSITSTPVDLVQPSGILTGDVSAEQKIAVEVTADLVQLSSILAGDVSAEQKVAVEVTADLVQLSSILAGDVSAEQKVAVEVTTDLVQPSGVVAGDVNAEQKVAVEVTADLVQPSGVVAGDVTTKQEAVSEVNAIATADLVQPSGVVAGDVTTKQEAVSEVNVIATADLVQPFGDITSAVSAKQKAVSEVTADLVQLSSILAGDVNVKQKNVSEVTATVTANLVQPSGIVAGDVNAEQKIAVEATADLVQPFGGLASAVVQYQRASASGDLIQSPGVISGVVGDSALVSSALVQPFGGLTSAVMRYERTSATGDLIQTVGIIAGVVNETVIVSGDLIEPLSVLVGKTKDKEEDKENSIFMIPDTTIEYPNRYNPLIKPSGSLCVEESHPLAKGLSFNLSSRDTLDLTNDLHSSSGTIKEISTERGLAFNFDGEERSLIYTNNRPVLNTDIGYSFFIMFKIKPPTYDSTSNSGIYLFKKFKSKNEITWRWHASSQEGRGIVANQSGYSWIPNVFETFGRSNDASNLQPRWYSLGITSASSSEIRIYVDGVKVKTVERGLDADYRNGTLLFGQPNRGKMKGQLSVCYEWYHALSDEEHASLALNPFQFLRRP